MIQIVYASTSGNVELVCEEISKILSSNGIENQLHRSEITSIDLIKENNMFILATSTWEHGEINPFFARLYNEMKEIDLKGKVAGFVGLGDIRYEPVQFCEGMNILRRSFIEKGGTELFHALRINGDPHDQIDNHVKPWVDSFMDALGTRRDIISSS